MYDVDLVERVGASLAAAGDPERAATQQAYMKSALPYHGITSAELKAVLRPILADHRIDDRQVWEATVRELWDGATHREQRYAATALLAHRFYRGWQDPDLLPLHRHLIVTGAWWDHVDELATRHVGPILASHRAELTPLMYEWAIEDDLWLRRTAILCQLHHKEQTDLACSGRRSTRTSTTRRSGSARRSAGRCGSMLGSTLTGCARRWRGTATASRDCPGERP